MSTLTIESLLGTRSRSSRARRWVASAIAIAPVAITATSFAAPAPAKPAASASVSASISMAPSSSASIVTKPSASVPTTTTSASIAPSSSAASGATTTAAATTTTSGGDADLPGDGGTLTLDEALTIFHKRGFDILLADASIYSAEGVELASGYHINPTVTGGVGKSFGYDASSACSSANATLSVDPTTQQVISTPGSTDCGASSWQFLVGINDNGEILENLVGKRPLRLKVARAALQVAKTTKNDTIRTLDGQLKTAFTQLALTVDLLDLAKEIQKASIKTLEINRLRYPSVIDEGALARIETAKLEADAGVDAAEQAVVNARAGVAYLLGVRTIVPKFLTPKTTLDFRIPGAIASASEDSLLHDAFTHRPDLLALGFQKERADASIELARRLRYPDVSLGLQYTQTGTGQYALSPPTLFFTVSATLPTFYSQEGEIQQAKADLLTQGLSEKKLQAQIVSDVTNGWANYKASRSLVERMESGLLDRATVARDIVEKQYKAGAQGITLTDFLDAYRTWIATKQEYLNDKQNYWSAIYQLEQAVGMELGK